MNVFRYVMSLMILILVGIVPACPVSLAADLSRYSCFGDSCSFKLDEDALKKTIAGRINLGLRKSGQFKGQFPTDKVEIVKVIPFQAGDIQLVAVRVKLLPLKPGDKPGVNFLIVDPKGQIDFRGLVDLATGESLDFEAMTEVRREKVPSDFGETLFSGDGKAEVVLVSDPMCPHCRNSYRFFSGNLNKVKSLKMVHFPLNGNPGVEVAGAVIHYAIENKFKPMDVVRFAFTELKEAHPKTENKEMEIEARREVISQFLDKFPELKEKLGPSPDAALKTLDKEALPYVMADKEKAQKMGITATPVIFINGVRLNGFKPEIWYAVLDEEIGATSKTESPQKKDE